MTHIPVFAAGVRISTWLGIFLFVNLACYRRAYRLSWRIPLFAGFVWMLGFEGAWQGTFLFFDTARLWDYGLYDFARAPVIVALAAFGVWYAWRRGIRPSLPIMAMIGLVWIAWYATGFDFNNHTMVGFNVEAEVFNETAKSLWALAYLVPLLRRPGWLAVDVLALRSPVRGVDSLPPSV